nr:SPOR domain-containing protein [Mariprofundus ferrinatatus]
MKDKLSATETVNLEKVYYEQERKKDLYLTIGFLVIAAALAGYLWMTQEEPAKRPISGSVGEVERTYHPPVAPAFSGVDQAIVIEPVADEPVTAEPEAAEPVAAESVAAESVAAEAVAAEAVAAEPVTAEPVTAEPVTAEPVTAEPVTAEPVTAEPVAAEPVAAEPVAAEPVAAEPVAAEPVAAETTGNQSDQAAWAVNLVSVTDPLSAQAFVDQLKSNGLDAETVQIMVGKQLYHRVRIANLESRKAADEVRASLGRNSAYKDAWINRYPK